QATPSTQVFFYALSLGNARNSPGIASPLFPERHPAAFDTLADICVGNAAVEKRRMGAAPGHRVIAVLELEQQYVVPLHVGEIPPAMRRIVGRDRGGDHVFLAYHRRDRLLRVWKFVDDEQRVGLRLAAKACSAIA